MSPPNRAPQIKYELRRATEADAEQIAALVDTPEDLRQVAPRESFPLDAPTVRHWLRERSAGYVLEQTGEILAYGELVVDSEDGGLLWIGHLMVHPRRRGLGLGKRIVTGLMWMGIERPHAREIAISSFEDNLAGLRCYRACGFRDRSRQRVDDRSLIELRYKIMGMQRIVSRPVAALLGVAAVGLSLLLSPWPLRAWLLDRSALGTSALVVGAALVVALLAVLLHPLLPRNRDPLSHQVGRPLLYGVAVALVGSWLMLFAAWILDIPLSEDLGSLALNVSALGLQYGAAWGLILFLGATVVPRLVAERQASGPSASSDRSR